MPFKIVRNDIVSMNADAIVNTANPKAIIGAGTDMAINEAAGEELIRARKEIGNIERGDAKETPAYNLKAKYVIHTVGPVWYGKEEENIKILKKCYSCL